MNIFETIQRAQPHRIEPFHSQFLADALEESRKGDCSLFEAVWNLAAPEGWEVPLRPKLSAEKKLEDGRRIDVCIESHDPPKRVLGIEVKTTDDSAEHGQLEQYLDDLKRKYPDYDVRVSYLTPFNEQQLGDGTELIHAVRVFEKFREVCPDARHFTWGDVAKISWDDNELWKQHQVYVLESMLPQEKHRMNSERNRDLAHFFGEKQPQLFWKALAAKDIYAGNNGVVIELERFKEDLQAFANYFTGVLEHLLKSDMVSRDAQKDDKFSAELRAPFLNSQYAEVHKALIGLSGRFPYVWIEGEGRYGVRVAHKEYSSGVSLVTSLGYDRLVVGQRR